MNNNRRRQLINKNGQFIKIASELISISAVKQDILKLCNIKTKIVRVLRTYYSSNMHPDMKNEF
jgi:hypothetical protein